MDNYKTEQEVFWAGEFGNHYTTRNNGANWIASNLALFSKILCRTNNLCSVIEFGANRGLNLQALRALLPDSDLAAVEINPIAVAELDKLQYVKTYNMSILDFSVDKQRDMALIKGVLIHINPEFLPNIYDLLYNSSKKYICIAEYYNPSPIEIPYRGHEGRLFKRDFAGEIMEKFSDLILVDYGFIYHRDSNFADDDITWFLLEKI